jgi:uncharacterized protein YjbI with pentapeptide repeats
MLRAASPAVVTAPRALKIRTSRHAGRPTEHAAGASAPRRGLPDITVSNFGRGVANAVVAALFSSLFATSAIAADLSVDQVRAAIANASPSVPADFAGKDLSDLDLSGLDFRKANLRGVNLFGSKLVQSDFREAILEGANLNGAWLMGTDFTAAKLNHASLLSVVVLGGEVKRMPIFKRADMIGVKMIADLPGADLSGANFSRASVGVNIKNQGMGQMRTDLSGANLAGATLAGADFNRSLMAFCNLKGSDLRGVSFFRAKLAGADLTGADVTAADFTEADLSGTIFRDVKGLAEARGLDRAENFDKIVR